MQINRKKLLSILFALAIVFGLAGVMPQTASAVTYPALSDWYAAYNTANPGQTVITQNVNDYTINSAYTLSDNVTVKEGDSEPAKPEEPTKPNPVSPQPITPVMPANLFTDVSDSDWFINDVIYTYNNGLMSGTSTSPMLFSPHVTLTRAMAVTVLYRLDGSPEVEPIYAAHIMDIEMGSWHENALGWAVKNSILSGYGEGFFGPNDNITREQLAALIFRYQLYSGKIPPNSLPSKEFTDRKQISGYAWEAINTLVMQGIISGKPGDLFDPKGNATRAEFAALIYRYVTSI